MSCEMLAEVCATRATIITKSKSAYSAPRWCGHVRSVCTPEFPQSTHETNILDGMAEESICSTLTIKVVKDWKGEVVVPSDASIRKLEEEIKRIAGMEETVRALTRPQ